MKLTPDEIKDYATEVRYMVFADGDCSDEFYDDPYRALSQAEYRAMRYLDSQVCLGSLDEFAAALVLEKFMDEMKRNAEISISFRRRRSDAEDD